MKIDIFSCSLFITMIRTELTGMKTRGTGLTGMKTRGTGLTGMQLGILELRCT